MLRLSLLFILIAMLASCKDSNQESVAADAKDTTETALRRESSACEFNNPDTSLSGIVLRDSETAEKLLGVKELLGDTAYYFSSKDRNQILEVKVYPGDGISQVSYFRVGSAVSAVSKAAPTSIVEFASEKGIRLGIAKEELVSLLGNCFTEKDSSASAITLSYRLELPADSKTGFLKRQNMPIYHGAYKFVNDKLSEFEFGFEYP